MYTSLTGSCNIKGYDAVIALDNSVSVGQNGFRRIIDFVSRIIERVDIGEQKTKVGIILFSGTATKQFDLNQHTTKNDLLSAISNIKYGGVAGNSYTRLLKELQKISQDPSQGFRADFDNIAIIITDAKKISDSDQRNLQMELRNTQNIFELYAVGIPSRREQNRERVRDRQLAHLQEITGDKSHAFIANELTEVELDQIEMNLAAELCERRSSKYLSVHAECMCFNQQILLVYIFL